MAPRRTPAWSSNPAQRRIQRVPGRPAGRATSTRQQDPVHAAGSSLRFFLWGEKTKIPARQRLAGTVDWWAVQGSNLRPLPCEPSGHIPSNFPNVPVSARKLHESKSYQQLRRLQSSNALLDIPDLSRRIPNNTHRRWRKFDASNAWGRASTPCNDGSIANNASPTLLMA